MEWVETTASSVTEAKDRALDKLGVHDSDALFEILEEPTKGFLGRTKGVARVRARIAPKAPPPKNDRNRKRGKSGTKDRTKSRNMESGGQRKGRGDSAKGSADGSSSDTKSQKRSRKGSGQDKKSKSRESAPTDAKASAAQGQRTSKQSNQKPRADKPKKEDTPVDQVVERVEEFLTGLVDAFGLSGEVSSTIDGDNLLANVGATDGVLIGPKGRTLDAIQELTRVSAQRLGPTSARIKVDIGGYREARKVALVRFAGQAAAKAQAEGIEVVLEPMSAADRKVLHDALGEIDGVTSRSAGNEPRRRVVVVPESTDSDDSAASATNEEE